MSLSYYLARIYFHSNLFILLAGMQIIINLGLLVYLLSDFSEHFKEPFVLVTEYMIALMMLADVTTYWIIQGIQIDLITFLECATLINFVICFILIGTNGIQKENEQYEIVLMILRFVLQIIRLPIGIVRLNEHNSKKKATIDFDFNEKPEESLDNSIRFRAIEMIEI